MAESQDRSSDQLPKLGDDDDDAGESTIAMVSPAFETNGASAPPLPISTPPPPAFEGAPAEDGPTMSDPLTELGSLELAEAARASVAASAPRRSPLAKTLLSATGTARTPTPAPPPLVTGPGPGSAPRPARPAGPAGRPSPLPRLSEQGEGEGEGATIAIPKEDLKPVKQRVTSEDEETRSVHRDEILRPQDAHVIVGADAIGDEATLAVLPGDNQARASNQGGIAAALAETLAHNDEPAFPPPPGPAYPHPHMQMQQQQAGVAGAIPMGHRIAHGPTALGLAPPPGPPPGPWSPPSSGAMPAASPYQGQPGMPPSGRMPVGMAPPMSMPQPMSMTMGMPGSMQHPGMQHPGMQQAGMQQPATQQLPLQPLGMQQSGMQQYGMPPSMQQQQQQRAPHAPAPWAQPMQPTQAAPASSPFGKVSGQMILLVVVGAVCLAIFITGIVLFATTRF